MDSLRWDYLLNSIAGKGIVVNPVVQRLFTPTSLSSLATGQCSTEHGVTDFQNKIPNSVPLFSESPISV